ncbi:Multivesicular body subunit 12B [Taenia crassiceps]|uniref:Multivesicular body subunit 12B n=1 Tax=Taenia crassiceps TaxID=6207 RepID=A0ABR4Q2A5_9CEST
MADPVTGIGIVASLSRVPSHYMAVKLTKDTHEDADFGRENILRKSSRYLVVEKMPCSKSSPRDVLVELALVGSKDAVPPDFTPIERTLDTRERCFKGKYLCAKYEPWKSNMTAVVDVVVFKNSRDVLKGHTLVGELSEQRILACVLSSLGSTTLSRKKAPGRPPEAPRKSIIYNPMSGVPFELTRDCRADDSDDIMSRYSLHPKSREAIEDQYSFDFSLEKTLKAS